MKKNLLLAFAVALVTVFQVSAEAHRRYVPAPRPCPPPPPPSYYQPYAPTCYARGMANGALFYGVGPDYATASNWAMYTCQSTGQYCQFLGCR